MIIDLGTATLVAAVIGAVTALVITVINLFQSRKLTQIHYLVNDRLDQALKEIDTLKRQMGESQQERTA
jgi:hypothetical protein